MQGGKEINAYKALSITSGALLEPKENLTIFITLGYDPVNSFKLAIQYFNQKQLLRSRSTLVSLVIFCVMERQKVRFD